MKNKQLTRKKFLDIAKLSVLFLLTSCNGLSRKFSIGLYKNFLPVSFINLLPKTWKKENLNYKEVNSNKNFGNSLEMCYIFGGAVRKPFVLLFLVFLH